jgi:hypothetical protein
MNVSNTLDFDENPTVLIHPILNAVCVPYTNNLQRGEEVKIIAIYVDLDWLAANQCYFIALGWNRVKMNRLSKKK